MRRRIALTQQAEPSRSELPLPDYDHLPIGSVHSRIRSLDSDGLTLLAAYERNHANRLPVLTLIEARLAELADGQQPSEGSPRALRPEAAPAPAGGTGVSPATSGPKLNPPSQGVPSNPAQPRSGS